MSFHPLFNVAIKLQLKQKLRKAGVNSSLADDLTPSDYETVAQSLGTNVPTELTVAPVPTDTGVTTVPVPVDAAGGIFAAILAFFTSSTGQALITALLKLLGVG